jgi:hypothetical protein
MNQTKTILSWKQAAEKYIAVRDASKKSNKELQVERAVREIKTFLIGDEWAAAKKLLEASNQTIRISSEHGQSEYDLGADGFKYRYGIAVGVSVEQVARDAKRPLQIMETIRKELDLIASKGL